MIERIIDNHIEIAVILRANFSFDGIKFLNDRNDSLQLGYMKRQKGHEIRPHSHKVIKRIIERTMEVLYIKSGKIEINFYNDKQIYLTKKVLTKGDTVILIRGGHGILMLEESEIIEIKQGPYLDKNDKTLISNHESSS